MNIETFLMLLMAVSVLCSLTTEALKKMFDGKVASNLIVAIVSVVLSITVGVCYCVITATAFNSTMVIYLIALVFLSWLCSMLGYDKVVQCIKQVKF